MRVSLIALLLAGLPSAAPAMPAAGPGTDAPAAVRSWHIENFRAEIRILPDGSVDVRERIRFRFDGSFEGIYRDIPIEYRQTAGFNYTLRLDDISVTDAVGNELRFETSR